MHLEKKSLQLSYESVDIMGPMGECGELQIWAPTPWCRDHWLVWFKWTSMNCGQCGWDWCCPSRSEAIEVARRWADENGFCIFDEDD